MQHLEATAIEINVADVDYIPRISVYRPLLKEDLQAILDLDEKVIFVGD